MKIAAVVQSSVYCKQRNVWAQPTALHSFLL